MAALKINWEDIEFIAKQHATTTGMPVSVPQDEASPFLKMKGPVLVYVSHPGGGGDGFEKLEQVTFANEKLGIATKAFRTVRITPDNVEKDLVLAGHGKAVPRLLVVNPANQKVKVLEKGKLKASTIYSTLKSVAGKCWKESLEATVKSQLKLLTEQDQVVNQMKVLRDKESRLGQEDSAKAKRELEKIQKEIEEVQTQLEDLAKQSREMWKLTSKLKHLEELASVE